MGDRVPHHLRVVCASLLLAVWPAPPPAPAADVLDARTALRLVFEIRDLVHRNYVEPVDSLAVIDAALDGLVAALPEGENLYLSPREMVELGAAPSALPGLRLDDRQQVELLGEAFRQVSRQYLARVGPDTLAHGMIWGLLAALDPHSSYLDPAAYANMVERFRGDFEGIGIYFEVRDGKLLVIAPIVGSPSYGKLRAGDHIVEIEGVSTDGITNEQVMEKLRGPKGSRVRVTVSRQGRPAPFSVEIQRDRIKVRSVPYVFMLGPQAGYVRIARFAETTGSELGRALDSLRSQGADQLLLDLRGNGGGLLSQAVEVADYFLDAGELIVYTEGRTAASRREYRAERPPRWHGLPTVVLIDHGSASASEIVAGALQDLDLALIAGQTSFGKGLVQEQFPLRANGGLLLLTVARYYTPLGRLIQRPYSSDLQAYFRAGTDDLDPNAVDSLRAGAQVFRTQLGRPVYSGGGITPDVLLAEEQYSEPVLDIYASGALADFCSRLVGARDDWPRDFAAFLADYEVEEATLDAFAASLGTAGGGAPPRLSPAERQFVRGEIKAGIAQVLWGDEQRYRVHVNGDKVVQQAVELFPQAAELARQRLRARGRRD